MFFGGCFCAFLCFLCFCEFLGVYFFRNGAEQNGGIAALTPKRERKTPQVVFALARLEFDSFPSSTQRSTDNTGHFRPALQEPAMGFACSPLSTPAHFWGASRPVRNERPQRRPFSRVIAPTGFFFLEWRFGGLGLWRGRASRVVPAEASARRRLRCPCTMRPPKSKLRLYGSLARPRRRHRIPVVSATSAMVILTPRRCHIHHPPV